MGQDNQTAENYNILSYCNKSNIFFSNKIICLLLVCFLIYEKLSEGSYYKDNNIQRILNN